MTQSDDTIDLGAVQRALRTELTQRGRQVSADSAGMRAALYITGPDDVALALFELKPNAGDAVYDLMFQGSWVSGMPPRFAVVPAAGADVDSLTMLEQMRAHPLLFEIEEGTVRFRDLDSVLAAHLDI